MTTPTGRVVWLEEAECLLPEVAGGKGASLARMRTAGMPVPPGFVVTAPALRESLAESGTLDEVERLVASYGDGGGEGVAQQVHEIVTGALPGKVLADDIAAAYRTLGDAAFVAVRSSACAEDGEAASFAGQQETFLNVVGADQVMRKLVECWGSFFSERALFYRRSKGSLADLGMAVVVQKQLASDKSGVMFTIDPIRRRRDQMVIEAAFGLGEALVSGMVTPDHYVVRRDGRLKKATVGRQDRMIVRDVSGGTVTVALDEETARSQVLDEADLARLVSAGIELEEAFGSPQDVEWALEGEELFVLQSRPITA